MRLKITVAVILLVLLTVGVSGQAQDEATPSPAPSKTPTSIPAPTTENSDTTQTQSRSQSWTQSDLSILTGNVQRPNGIYWHDGRLYTACNGDATLYNLDALTGETRLYVYGVRNAHMLYAETLDDGQIDVWAPDFETNRLLRLDQFGPEEIAGDLERPWGIAYLDENHFLITSLLGQSLMVVSREGEVRRIVDNLPSPTGVALDEAYVYFGNFGSARRAVEWISRDEIPDDPDARIESQVLVTGLQNVTGVVAAPDGFVYFAYALGTRGVVGRVDPEICLEQGGCTNEDVEIVIYSELAAPLAGLSISPDMRLYVHAIYKPEIYWVQLDSVAEEVAED